MRTPIWSPDGKTIAATDMAGHPLLHSFPRSVDDPLPEPGPLPGKDLRFQQSSWSSDSKHLAGVIVRVDGSANGIVIYDVEKKTYRRAIEVFGIAPDDRGGNQVDRVALADVELETIAGVSQACRDSIEQAVLAHRLGEKLLSIL